MCLEYSEDGNSPCISVPESYLAVLTIKIHALSTLHPKLYILVKLVSLLFPKSFIFRAGFMPLLRYAPNLKYSIFYPLSNQLELSMSFILKINPTLQRSLPSAILAHMNCTFPDFPQHSCLQDSWCPLHTLTPAILTTTGIYVHWHLSAVPTSLVSSLRTWYRWLPWSIIIIVPLSIFQLLQYLLSKTPVQV